MRLILKLWAEKVYLANILWFMRRLIMNIYEAHHDHYHNSRRICRPVDLQLPWLEAACVHRELTALTRSFVHFVGERLHFFCRFRSPFENFLALTESFSVVWPAHCHINKLDCLATSVVLVFLRSFYFLIRSQGNSKA